MRNCNDLIQAIVNSIFRQEGMGQDYVNPGNLRFAPWFSAGKYPDGEALTYSNGFWIPRSRAEGVAGAAHVVALHIAEGDNLTQLIGGKPGYGGWAPATDGNKTAEYIANVQNWAAIPDATLPLWSYILEPVT